MRTAEKNDRRRGLPRGLGDGVQGEKARERKREKAQRWYRVAVERNVVTFKLEWTTVCVPESRVGSLSSSGRQERGPSSRRPSRIYGRFAYTQRGNAPWWRGLTDEGSYSKQRVAPKPSSRHAILSFHNERVPSRSVSRRNFNTLVYLTNVRPYPSHPLIPLPARFRSRVLRFFLRFFYISRLPFRPFLIPLHPFIRPTLFRPSPPTLVPPFSPVEFLQVPLDIYPRRELVRRPRNRLFVFPRREREESGKTRRGCETGIGNLSSVKRARSPAILSRTKAF